MINSKSGSSLSNYSQKKSVQNNKDEIVLPQYI